MTRARHTFFSFDNKRLSVLRSLGFDFRGHNTIHAATVRMGIPGVHITVDLVYNWCEKWTWGYTMSSEEIDRIMLDATLDGFASIVIPPSIEVPDSGFETDKEAIQRDWETVGDDIRQALEKFGRQRQSIGAC